MCRIQACTPIQEADNNCVDNTEIKMAILVVKTCQDIETDTTLALI
jgi:hypothetical protein